jgi:large subunit ribosomal protein L17
MRHRVKKAKFGRQNDHMRALLRNLVTSVILYEKVRTTKAKAKAVQPRVEKLISLARKVQTGKKSEREAIRLLQGELYDEKASRKLLQEIAGRYADRDSGFTRVINLENRPGDNAEMAQIELV